MECIREGCKSEALRRLSGSVQENQCFTVVFKGARKSLDLMCPDEGEAQSWVRGLRTLKEYVANMSQKEKLDQYPAALSITESKYSPAEAVLPRSVTLQSHVITSGCSTAAGGGRGGWRTTSKIIPKNIA